MIAPEFKIQMTEGAGASMGTRLVQALRSQLDADATVSILAGGQRGIDRNTMIARVQAENDRNPFYLTEEHLEAVRFIMRGFFRDPDRREQQLKRLGRFVLDSILGNVTDQANKGGKPFKALTQSYAKYKQRKHGFTVPILKATNDLLGGLRVVIERRR